MLSDEEIMMRVKSGEVGLFSLLVDRYRSRLVRFAASKLNHQQDAEDCVQNAFLAAWNARDTYSQEFAFSTWIWTITLNLARRTLRQQSNRVERHENYVLKLDSSLESPSTLSLMLDSEQIQQLDEWLKKIPEMQSDAIRLKFFGRLSYQEIAWTMDCSVSGAKRRVKNGMIKLSSIAESD